MRAGWPQVGAAAFAVKAYYCPLTSPYLPNCTSSLPDFEQPLKMRRILTLLVVALIAAAVAIDLRCPQGQTECLVILRETGDRSLRCYDPQTHVCVDKLVCPKLAPNRCGDACYSSQDNTGYVCHNDSFLCPKTMPEICGNACYSPAHFKCVDGHLEARE